MNLARSSRGGVAPAAWAVLALAGPLPGASLPAPVDPEAASAPLPTAIGRCKSAGELIACYAALAMKPNDPGLLVAEADALMAAKRPGEAIGVYKNALHAGAERGMIAPKIAAAESLRLHLLTVCSAAAGSTAEGACEAAWLPGAPDEVAVFKRRGALLRSDNRTAAALDAYLAAARLAPRDREAARNVVDLSDLVARTDANTLTARGAALLTLGRPAEAVAPLRQALHSEPGLGAARALLRDAQHLAARPAPAAVRAAVPVADADAADTPHFSNAAPATRTN